MKITKATRWRVFAGVWIQSLFTSATAFFSLFCLPFCNQFGWSNSDFSMAYTIYMFIYCAVGFLGGILAEKLQPRVAIYIGLVLFAGGWILTGFASSIPFLYIAYGVIAGAGAGTIYPACLPTALKWFPDKSGSISGLVQAGAACGPFIMSPIAQMLIDNFGAPMACKILGVVFLIGVGAVAWMIVPCPDGWTPEGWVPSAQQSKELSSCLWAAAFPRTLRVASSWLRSWLRCWAALSAAPVPPLTPAGSLLTTRSVRPARPCIPRSTSLWVSPAPSSTRPVCRIPSASSR